MDKLDKVLGWIETLADKLGTTVEELAPHAIRHVQLEAWGSVGLGLFFAMAICITGIWFGAAVRAEITRDAKPDAATARMAATAGVFLATVLLFGIAIGCTCESLADALEPTGALVRQVLGK